VIGTTTATRSYSSGIAGRIGALVGGLVAVPIVAYALPALLLGEALDVKDNRILIATFIGVLVVGGVWVLVHVFVTGPVRFVTDARYVRLHRGGRVRNVWERDETTFASFVQRESMNGMPAGSTRRVIASTTAERVDVLCRWFTASTFNDLMNDIAPVIHLDDPGISSGVDRTFKLDPAASGLRRTGRSVVIILALLSLVALGVAASVVAGATYVDEAELLFLGGMAVVVLLLVVIAFASSRRRVSKVPSTVRVSSSAIQIDQVAYNLAQLSSIVLTPPSYSMNSRTMVLVATTGERTKVSLGSGYGMKSVFADYGEFVEMLQFVAPDGLVRFDLR
jgi:hypothetical protein